MRVLLTNDDGVHAPGLAALVGSLSAEHQVTVVAPETEQSAVGHAITLADPIRVRRLERAEGMAGWAISGTPADCVKLAICELTDQRPQMVVSGINLGANVGVNVLYSGTVSAASEAAIYGIPGLAISLDTFSEPDFSFAARLAAHLVSAWPTLGLDPSVCLNVNVPALPSSQIKGLRFTRQSSAPFRERFLRRHDPRGRTYYWQAGEKFELSRDEDVDHTALLAGYVTLTPVRHDLTHEQSLHKLAGRRLELPKE